MKRLKLHLENLGPIQSADIEISPLTIICGSNNSGKTYLSYTIYGLLKTWYKEIEFAELKDKAEEFVQKGTVSIDLRKWISENRDAVDVMLQDYTQGLDNLFSAPKGTFSKTKITSETIFEFSDDNEESLQSEITSLGRVKLETKNGFLIITSIDTEKNNNRLRAEGFIGIWANVFAYSEYFPDPFISSAERLGISLFYKELDAHRNALVDTLMQLKDGQKNFNPLKNIEKAVARYSVPVKDNIQFTRELDQIKKNKSFLQDEEEKIYTDIEKMLGGEYKINGEEILFKSKSRTAPYTIPSYLGSSAVRTLSDIYFYLKHKASKGQLLLIDEPESHLTPANQIQMARIIARLVKSGINVFITTHSDYIIKELSNLICLNSNFSNKEKIIKTYGYKPTDKLDPKVVSAYIAKNGKLEECEVTAKGIEVKSFDEAIDQINSTIDDLLYYMDAQ